MIDQSKNARSIFLEIVEQAPHERWAESLDRACGDDQQLRKRVQRLLDAHEEIGSFMDRPAADPFTIDVPIAEAPGTVIGPYKLLQQIGEGGFGVVFLAEQERPVKRRVALKLIKPGMDTRQVIARFEAERQALAMMDHPNIAKVYDAGATETGRPYFVMELVQGVPITEYCDQCNLTIRERLELFITVCQAVQHAHQKGIIHRDIKPTNVLVAMQDGQAAPKIIDFGVAKAIEQRLTEHTLTTAFAQMVGTPLYMSPEQAELSPLGVDTRSDIYSLGVLLYELLTSTTPFDKDRLHAASYDELRHIIREEDPPRPSARISTLAADLATTVAECRRIDARRLHRTVQGELDWIVMKCLEKDRNRRYDSAGSLARDIERYLHDEPVEACPPSVAYRLKKFVRRNKVAAAFVVLLLICIAGLGVSNIVIKRERDARTTALAQATTESARARSVSNLLQEMLGSADTEQAKGNQYTVRELLDDFSTQLGNQLADQPAVDADIHATIGRAYRSLRLPDQAQPHFEKAIELQKRANGPQQAKLADMLVDYGWNFENQQKFKEAEVQLRKALEIYRAEGVAGAPLIHALRILELVMYSTDRSVAAKSVYQQALAVAGPSGEERRELASLLTVYAGVLNKATRYEEGEKVARRAVDMDRHLYGDQHPETAWGLRALGSALQAQQKLDEAEPVLRESLTIFRRGYADDHVYVQWVADKLRTVLEARGDTTALETLAKEKAEQASRSDSPKNHIRLAGLLLEKHPTDDQKQEAHQLIRWAIQEYGRVTTDSPGDFSHRIDAADSYARALQICAAVSGFQNEVDDLNRLLAAELPRLVADFPDVDQRQWEIAMCYNSWGRVLIVYSDQLPTAEHAFRESNEILKKLSLSVPNRPYVWIWLASTYSGLGDAQWRSGRPDDAQPPLRMAMKIYDEHREKIAADIAADPFPGINSEIVSAHIHYAFFLAAAHREKEAAEFVGKAAHDAKRLTDPIELVNSLCMTALAQLQLGDEAGYRATCRALVKVPVASADDVTKSRAIWSWCLAPNALEDLSLPVKRAEEVVANNSLNQRHFELQLLGAALYRAGRYEQAAERFQESIVAYPSDPPPGFESINYTRLLLAMTNWQLGNHDEARRLFAEARLAVDTELQSPSVPLHRRATLEALRREAKTLIGKSGAGEAVENEGRNSNEPEHPHP